MDIQDFADALAEKLGVLVPDAKVSSEAGFEREYVIGPAWELSRENPEIHVFAHPQTRKETCRGDCNSGELEFSRRVQGCPECWKLSKKWSRVDAFGTKNNFDLVAIDRARKTLAVEVKWLEFSEGRGPNSEFQRFIGQCTLASAVNHVVLGVCGFRGNREKIFDKHEARVLDTLKKIGVSVVVMAAKVNGRGDMYQISRGT